MKKMLCTTLIFCLIFTGVSQAISLPKVSFFSSAVSKLVQKGCQKLGVAANDPRVSKTIDATNAVLVGLVTLASPKVALLVALIAFIMKYLSEYTTPLYEGGKPVSFEKDPVTNQILVNTGDFSGDIEQIFFDNMIAVDAGKRPLYYQSPDPVNYPFKAQSLGFHQNSNVALYAWGFAYDITNCQVDDTCIFGSSGGYKNVTDALSEALYFANNNGNMTGRLVITKPGTTGTKYQVRDSANVAIYRNFGTASSPQYYFRGYRIPVKYWNGSAWISDYIILAASGTNVSHDAPMFVNNTGNVNEYPSLKYNTEPVKLTVEKFIETLPSSAKDKNLDKDFIADILNAVWSDAEQTGTGEVITYNPYVALNSADVESTLHPSLKLQDVLFPIPEYVKDGTTGSTKPIGSANSNDIIDGISPPKPGQENVNTGSNNTGSGGSMSGSGSVGSNNFYFDVELDFGSAPIIDPPNLEEIPTVESILDPIFNLFPFLQNYQIANRNVDCPIYSFEIWGKPFVIDSHCVLVEDNRAFIESFMGIFWLIASLFIVLRA